MLIESQKGSEKEISSARAPTCTRLRCSGYSEEEATWEPKSKIAAELVADFHKNEQPEPASPKAHTPTRIGSIPFCTEP